ncbi:DUF4252 domain-containing protein [Flavobacterium album]|uniref:DUF4252 domain-containing protein n=1 Tax=Flavobacterium album TaxID=2175091 RepID=A0A2S1QYC2_9FLAO|nr:DUF4252 domain-containing protein [Flavobacterium album]AWH85382.1 DUF4252 domain-containing protein [Flavobacterium album]
MKRSLYLFGLMLLVLASCSQEPSLQKYYIEKGEAPGFITLDIAPTFIKRNEIKLTPEEKAAVGSLHKFNVLIYKTDSLDVSHKRYEQELEKVKGLIKGEYEELIKINNGESGASISTKGNDEHIEEFVVFVRNQDTGFGVVRVLGDDMTPNNVLTIAGLLQKANIDTEQFKPLQELMNKK